MIALLSAWAFLFAAYLVFAGQISGDETGAGVVCAAAAVLWWRAVRRASSHGFAFEAGAWSAAGRAVRTLPRATLATAAALWRGRGGGIVQWRFIHGRSADPRDAGRRAVGVLAASLAPDGFVLRTPVDADAIIVHALSSSEPPKDARWPI